MQTKFVEYFFEYFYDSDCINYNMYFDKEMTIHYEINNCYVAIGNKDTSNNTVRNSICADNIFFFDKWKYAALKFDVVKFEEMSKEDVIKFIQEFHVKLIELGNIKDYNQYCEKYNTI